MTTMKDLLRQYEHARYPADRRLDLHAEGPGSARERALRWIQSRAHEAPGQELLLILERGRRPDDTRPSPVVRAVTSLLDELRGGLIDWWQPFTPGSVALRISDQPRIAVDDVRTESPRIPDDIRFQAGRESPLEDIPAHLLEQARIAAELRLRWDGLSTRLERVMLREVWIEVQARAMDRRLTFEAAMEQVLEEERARLGDEM